MNTLSSLGSDYELYNQENSLNSFREYFRGGSLDYFSPKKTHVGGGIGGILKSVFKSVILPTVKSVGKKALKSAVSSGMSVAKDVMSGEKLKSSLKKQGAELAIQTLTGGLGSISKDNKKGVKRKASVSRRKGSKRARRVEPRDIFS